MAKVVKKLRKIAKKQINDESATKSTFKTEGFLKMLTV